MGDEFNSLQSLEHRLSSLNFDIIKFEKGWLNNTNSNILSEEACKRLSPYGRQLELFPKNSYWHYAKDEVVFSAFLAKYEEQKQEKQQNVLNEYMH